jgi:hypothetical protein
MPHCQLLSGVTVKDFFVKVGIFEWGLTAAYIHFQCFPEQNLPGYLYKPETGPEPVKKGGVLFPSGIGLIFSNL